MDLWLNAAERCELSSAVLLDLAAGFDVINHPMMIQKLSLYGFSNEALNLMKDYLSNRMQCVQIESKCSSLLEVPFGIPQGSILGPLMFVVFINELPMTIKVDNLENNDDSEEEITNPPVEKPEVNSIVIYADDNTPTTSDKNCDNLITNTQENIDKVSAWFAENDMIVSGDKTKLLVLGTKKNRSNKITDDISLHVCGTSVEPTESERLLGVIISDDLTWKSYLHGSEESGEKGLIKQLSMRVGMLSKLRKNISVTQYKQLMAGIFTSKLIYCISVWASIWGIPGIYEDVETSRTSMTKQDMRKLQTLQNKALRLTHGTDRSESTKSLLRKTNSLSVHQLASYLTLTEVFKICRSELPAYHYKKLFGMDCTNNKANRIDFDLSLGRGSFFYQGSRLWNAIPSYMKVLENELSFKLNIREWIKDNIKIKP